MNKLLIGLTVLSLSVMLFITNANAKTKTCAKAKSFDGNDIVKIACKAKRSSAEEVAVRMCKGSFSLRKCKVIEVWEE